MQFKRFSLGPIHFYRQALRFAVPVMIQTFVQSLISLIDNFMVGGLGDIVYLSLFGNGRNVCGNRRHVHVSV